MPRGRPKKLKAYDPTAKKGSKGKKQVIELLPKQMEYFMDDKTPELLFSCGRGGGKSTVLCIKLLKDALLPNARVGLFRKYLSNLKATTLRILLNGDGSNPPLLPVGTYEHNMSNKTIKLKNGGEIFYSGTEDNIEKIQSLNLSSIYIDEGWEISEDIYKELLLRLRVDIGTRQCNIVTNASNKNHWIYKRFFNNTPNTKVIYGTSLENTFLPKDFVENRLQTLTGNQYESVVNAAWIALDKVIFNEFNYDRNVIDSDKIPKSELVDYYVSVDPGVLHGCGILFSGITKDNIIYCIDYVNLRKKTLNDVISKLQSYSQYNPTYIIDPSGAQTILECEAAGLNAIKANNDVNIGIQRVNARFANRSILISNKLTEFINEIVNYSYSEDFKVVKIEDESCDVLRYLVNNLSENIAEAVGGDKFYIF